MAMTGARNFDLRWKPYALQGSWPLAGEMGVFPVRRICHYRSVLQDMLVWVGGSFFLDDADVCVCVCVQKAGQQQNIGSFLVAEKEASS